MSVERFHRGDRVVPHPGVLEPGEYECGDPIPHTDLISLRKLPEKLFRFRTHQAYLTPANENKKS